MDLPSTSNRSLPQIVLDGLRPMSPTSQAMIATMSKGLVETAPGKCTISRALAPSAEQRGWMEARRGEMALALEPGDRSAIHDRLHRFAFGFGQIRSLDPASCALMLEEWVDSVEEMPLEAVNRACKAWTQGKLGWVKTGMAPNADEINRAARQMLLQMRVEDRDLCRLIEARSVDPEPPLTEDQKAENRERIAALLDDLKNGRAVKSLPAPEPSRPDRDPNLTADLESRRIRRETREATEAESDPPVLHPSHEETESAS